MTYADAKVTAPRASVHHVFLNYTYLQILDFLTTIAFLVHGVREANPFVRMILGLVPNPIAGLLAVKLLALLLGIYCWRMKRERLLIYINAMFAILVAWNLIALILISLPGSSA
ncbi:MAG TPA: DUF5658 family protein [Bryobacteraceae bacterium]|nr:DUF5658 family protein [Bryobacteraceae bacterium]